MCHKHEMMEHFYSKLGRTHRSVNPARPVNVQSEMLSPDDVIIYHDDELLEERTIFCSTIAHIYD